MSAADLNIRFRDVAAAGLFDGNIISFLEKIENQLNQSIGIEEYNLLLDRYIHMMINPQNVNREIGPNDIRMAEQLAVRAWDYKLTKALDLFGENISSGLHERVRKWYFLNLMTGPACLETQDLCAFLEFFNAGVRPIQCAVFLVLSVMTCSSIWLHYLFVLPTDPCGQHRSDP